MNEIQFQNSVVLSLVSALLGSVSDNLVGVWITIDDLSSRDVALTFVLACESVADREEIEDVAAEFEAFEQMQTNPNVRVLIGIDQADAPSHARWVFLRRARDAAEAS